MIASFDYELFHLIPPIKRARGYYLYDYAARRYIDMFQNNGRALTGHRPRGVAGALKSTLSKGLLANYPSVYTKRLAKALLPLFPDHPGFRVYGSAEKAVAAAALALGKQSGETGPGTAGRDRTASNLVEHCIGASFSETVLAVKDPAAGPITGCEAALWRPFLEEETKTVPILFPVLPFPGDFGVAVVCCKQELADRMPPDDPVSPVLLASLIRSIFTYRDYRETMHSHRWNQCDSVYFKQKGPYLSAQCGADEYKKLFREALSAGILIAPDPEGVTILPAEYTDGDWTRIRRSVMGRP